ncbi:MAG: hypothetical protein AB1457_09590 [Chloroflexota bacterium]
MSLQNESRPPLRWQGYEISAVSQAFRFEPSPQFGMIWNRPIGVRVQTPQGEQHYLPVYDVTRLVQILIVLGGLVLFLFLKMISRRRSK